MTEQNLTLICRLLNGTACVLAFVVLFGAREWSGEPGFLHSLFGTTDAVRGVLIAFTFVAVADAITPIVLRRVYEAAKKRAEKS